MSKPPDQVHGVGIFGWNPAGCRKNPQSGKEARSVGKLGKPCKFELRRVLLGRGAPSWGALPVNPATGSQATDIRPATGGLHSGAAARFPVGNQYPRAPARGVEGSRFCSAEAKNESESLNRAWSRPDGGFLGELSFPGRIAITMSKRSTPEIFDYQENPYRSGVFPVSLNRKFFDRIDLHVEAPSGDFRELSSNAATGEKSISIPESGWSGCI